MEIRQLTDAAEKQAVTRLILEALPEWFGIPAGPGGVYPGKCRQDILLRL